MSGTVSALFCLTYVYFLFSETLVLSVCFNILPYISKLVNILSEILSGQVVWCLYHSDQTCISAKHCWLSGIVLKEWLQWHNGSWLPVLVIVSISTVRCRFESQSDIPKNVRELLTHCCSLYPASSTSKIDRWDMAVILSKTMLKQIKLNPEEKKTSCILPCSFYMAYYIWF